MTSQITDASKRKRRLTKKQKAWADAYQNFFGMEAMYVEDYKSGEFTWGEVCQHNYNWLEDWLNDGTRLLEGLQRA